MGLNFLRHHHPVTNKYVYVLENLRERENQNRYNDIYRERGSKREMQRSQEHSEGAQVGIRNSYATTEHSD